MSIYLVYGIKIDINIFLNTMYMSSDTEYYTDDESVHHDTFDVDEPDMPVIDLVHVVAPLADLVPLAEVVPVADLVPVAEVAPLAEVVPLAHLVPVVNLRSVQDSVDSLIQKRSCLPSRVPVLSASPSVSWCSCFPWVQKVTLPTAQADTQSQTVSDKVSDPGSLHVTVPPTQASS